VFIGERGRVTPWAASDDDDEVTNSYILINAS